MMREAIKDYLSIALSILMLGVLFYVWASSTLDDKINTAVSEAMVPFVTQLETNTQTLRKHDDRLKSLENQVSAVDEVEF